MLNDPDRSPGRSSGVALGTTEPAGEPIPNIRREQTPNQLDLMIRNPSQEQETIRPSTMAQLDTVPQSSHRVATQPSAVRLLTSATRGAHGTPVTNQNRGTSGNRGTIGTIRTSFTSVVRGRTAIIGNRLTNVINRASGSIGTSLTNVINRTSGTISSNFTNVIHGASGSIGTSLTNVINGTSGTISSNVTNVFHGASGSIGTSLTNVINGTSGTISSNVTNLIHGASGSIGISITNVINTNRSQVSADGGVEFVGEFGNPRRGNTPNPNPLAVVPEGSPELQLQSSQTNSEASKRPLEPLPPSRVVRRRNSLDGRDDVPAWSRLLPLPRNRNPPAPLSAENYRELFLRREEEKKIRRAGYTQKEIRDMRRTIRLSANSTYHYRELMSEVKKWFADMETVLRADEFSGQLQPYFTDMACANEYFQLIPKPVMKMEDMTGAILKEKLEQFKADMISFKNQCGLEQPSGIKNDPNNHPEASTSSGGASMRSTVEYKSRRGHHVERQQNAAAIIKQNYKQISTEVCLEQINKAKKDVYFRNRIYSSDSD